MIVNEKPDIVSIATQPYERAEIAPFAIENGVKVIYGEKPLCASVTEAETAGGGGGEAPELPTTWGNEPALASRVLEDARSDRVRRIW